MADCEILIAGAGPTGLVLALWLHRQGVHVRIIDKAAEPGTTSRALAVQARTIELYRQTGLADEVIRRAHATVGAHLWVQGRQVAHVPFAEIGRGESPAPFFLVFPQDEHERLLIDTLAAEGVTVERPIEIEGFSQDAGGVVARLRWPDGRNEDCRAAYLAGCDGAKSVVRHGIKADFPGGTYQRLFYVADVEAEGPAVNGDLNVDLDEADFLAVFPLAAPGHVRLIGTILADRVADAEHLTFDDVSDQAIRHLKVGVKQVNWFSTYHVHHRVADQFSEGRVFLLGDAAHIHSPVGGQGMNTGIGDAINLAWKLAAVLNRRAPAALLASYGIERMAFARRLVATTDRGFTFVTAEGPVAEFVRTKVAPLAIPTIVNAAQDFIFRTVGQLNLEYHGSPLSQGHAGRVRGGDRLPWVKDGRTDNFAPLAEMAWQVHVYGDPAADLSLSCAAHGLPLHVFEWSEASAKAGLARNAVYLLRPDTYVAMTDPTGSPDVLDRYFSERGIKP